jgi:antitoxin VapB
MRMASAATGTRRRRSSTATRLLHKPVQVGAVQQLLAELAVGVAEDQRERVGALRAGVDHGDRAGAQADNHRAGGDGRKVDRQRYFCSTADSQYARAGAPFYITSIQMRYLSTIGLNIKNERTTALVRELAHRTGLSQTAAVEEAVRAKLDELDRGHTDADVQQRRDARRARAQQLLSELHNSLTDAERAQVKAAERQLYDDAGLPS